MKVTLVVAMGANGAIGVDDALPWHLPEDLAHFKRLTLGHPIVMGRATFESIGRPLPGRTTIVVTRDPLWGADGVQKVGSLTEALAVAAELDDEVFIAGGAQIYRQMLEAQLVDTMVVTEVGMSPEADTYFPSYDREQWREVERTSHEAERAGSPLTFDIVTSVRR